MPTYINIGEQIKALSDRIKEQNPEIPYRKIIGLRNMAAHSHQGLEAFRLYVAIRENVPYFASKDISNSKITEF